MCLMWRNLVSLPYCPIEFHVRVASARTSMPSQVLERCFLAKGNFCQPTVSRHNSTVRDSRRKATTWRERCFVTTESALWCCHFVTATYGFNGKRLMNVQENAFVSHCALHPSLPVEKSIFMFVPHSRSNERWPVAWYRVILARAGMCFVPIVLGEIQDAASCVSQKMSGHIGGSRIVLFHGEVSTCETGSTFSCPVPNTWAASVVEKSVGSRELEIYLRMYCKLDKYSVADLFQQIHFESNHEISLQLHETSHHHHSTAI